MVPTSTMWFHVQYNGLLHLVSIQYIHQSIMLSFHNPTEASHQRPSPTTKMQYGSTTFNAAHPTQLKVKRTKSCRKRTNLKRRKKGFFNTERKTQQKVINNKKKRKQRTNYKYTYSELQNHRLIYHHITTTQTAPSEQQSSMQNSKTDKQPKTHIKINQRCKFYEQL